MYQNWDNLSKSRKGDIGEIFVVQRALLAGANVYKNVGCDGSVDLVIESNGEFVKIDVKTAQKQTRNKSPGHSWQQSRINTNNDIYFVLYIPDGYGQARWFRGRQGQAICPAGWENFFDD